MNFKLKNKILEAICSSLFSTDNIQLSPSYLTTTDCVLDCVSCFSKEDVEKCKQKDLLEQTMSEMIGEFPALHQTIVAERDIYLTHTLRQATRCVEAPPNAQSEYYTLSNLILVLCRLIFSSIG